MTDWKTHTPQYDGHAPDDWEDGMEWRCRYEGILWGETWVTTEPSWLARKQYQYRAKVLSLDALLAQCLALPQADRDALIAELQNPVRDWADDVWRNAFAAWYKTGEGHHENAAAAIRSMCLSKSDPLLSDIYYFLICVDEATELRGRLIKVIKS